jgi:beta-aspartyl-peptidase (threonine type)
MRPKIVVHGGVANRDDRHEGRLRTCEKAVEKAYVLLERGENGLFALETAVNILEDDPDINSGTGSYFQLDGNIRMDAVVMSSDLRAGGVLQVTNVKNPISVAKKILEKGYHVYLTGDFASRFAYEEGFAFYNQNQTLLCQKTWEKSRAQITKPFCYEQVIQTFKNDHPEKWGTCGCVLIDQQGTLFAGTSTGGLEKCYPGRLGDAGVVGCGTYANKHAAVSCTGEGEKIIRATIAREVAYLVEQGLTAQKACDKAIELMFNSLQGELGIIAIDHQGNIGIAYNTEVMSNAYRD